MKGPRDVAIVIVAALAATTFGYVAYLNTDLLLPFWVVATLGAWAGFFYLRKKNKKTPGE